MGTDYGGWVYGHRDLAGITQTQTPVAAATIEDLIAEGESDELEFKSTLRWDPTEAKPNKKLEEVVIKTVAAFGNSEGGTLLIGVSDSGEVLGLENDYSTLTGGNRDKFELHLRNLLSASFGTIFPKGKIRVAFPSVANSEICQVEVGKANEPLFVKAPDKSGNLTDRFYVRVGNSSQELSISEMPEYLKDRFS